MTCPRYIFLDTSVFDGLGYDFEKPAAQAFVGAVTRTGASLVLPAGIEQVLGELSRAHKNP